MGNLVTDDGGQLGLILTAQHEAAPDRHEAVGCHRRIEARPSHRVGADLITVVAGQSAGEVVDIGLKVFVGDDLALRSSDGLQSSATRHP